MKKWNKLLIVYIVLLAMALVTMYSIWQSFGRPATSRDLPEIKKEGILRMTTEYSPVGYYVEGDTTLGFQYELCQEIAKLSGLEVQLSLEMSLPTAFQQLDDRTTDVIARNIPITTENKECYLFTEPILLNRQVLVQRTEEANGGVKPIHDQLRLGGKKLFVPKGSPARLRIRNLAHEIGDTIEVQEEEHYSDEQLIIMVAKGDIDFAVCDLKNAQQMQQHYPEIDITTDISFTQLQSWAVRKESKLLLDSLNSWIKTLKESEIYHKIYHRYYK